MWEVVGQERAVAFVRGAVEAERLPHALLLTGPSGVGKRTLALEIARALNCVGTDPPCHACLHCRQIEAGTHPDVTVIERVDGKDHIAIQQIRLLRDAASLRPFQGRTKVYIVADAEGLTAQAADALLKTLEEPQPQVALILTAGEVDALPATVVSRCQVLALAGVDRGTIARVLRDRGLATEPAETIARLARGSIGWALTAAAQPKLVSQREEMVGKLCATLDLDVAARLQLAEQLTGDRKDRAAVRRNLELLVLLARDALLLGQGQASLLATGRQQEMLRAQAARLGPARLLGYIDRLRLTMERIDQNVDPRLALEALLVNLP